MVFPRVREMAAAGAPIRVPVAVACRVLGLTRQGYYKWLKDSLSQPDWDDAHVIDALLDIHRDDPTLGYRFLTDELQDERGIVAQRTECGSCAQTAGIFAEHRTGERRVYLCAIKDCYSNKAVG